MKYSLRQLEAFTWLRGRRRKMDDARALQIAYMARGKQKDVEKKVKEWTK
jgi:hypothetical protein